MKIVILCGVIGGFAVVCLAWGTGVLRFLFPSSLIGAAIGIAIGAAIGTGIIMGAKRLF